MTVCPTPVRRSTRRWAFALLVALGLGAAGWWGYREFALDRHWQAAQAALELHDGWRAYEELQPCLLAWGDRQEILLVAARAARLAGALDDAEAHVAACERLAPTDDDVRFERMLLQAQQGDLQPYQEPLRRLLATPDERQPTVLAALAGGLADTLQINEAAAYLDKIAQRDPEFVPMLLLAGELRVRYQHPTEARPFLEKAVERLPHALTPRLRLAECLLQLGAVREAAAHLELLRQQRPDHAEVLLALARCRGYRNQSDSAQKLLDHLLLKHPQHLEALVERGRLEQRVGDPILAQSWLRRALEINPDHLAAWQILEASCLAAAQADPARACRVEIERIELESGRVQRLVVQAAQAPTPSVTVLTEVGDRWRRLHNGREAQKYLFSALQIDPRHGPTHRALAELFEQTGQPHRAARHRALAGT